MSDGENRREGPRQLRALVDNAREDLDVEIKPWLDLKNDDDRANIAQALLALANHGGGYVLLGFKEDEGRWVPDGARPESLENYSQDAINGIVLAYADPPFHCQVDLVSRSDSEAEFPVVVVPGGHTVPVRAKRDGPGRRHVHQHTYYIRRPGPCSESPRSAQEWTSLITRCVRGSRDELLEVIRGLFLGSIPDSVAAAETLGEPSASLSAWTNESEARWKELIEGDLGEEQPSRFALGTWYGSYQVSPIGRAISGSDLRQILLEIVGRETGWPVWLVGSGALPKPYPHAGLVECWLAPSEPPDKPAYSDFWRVSPFGTAFLVRGYQEDSYPERRPLGQFFDSGVPVWRAAEVLLHAARLAARIGGDGATIELTMSWRGLRGRQLASVFDPSRWVPGGRVSNQDVVSSTLSVQAERVEDSLPELVHRLTASLYECFDFYAVPIESVAKNIAEMRRGSG